MNTHQQNLGSRVGVFTLASMLVALVGLSLLLVVSDARASNPEFRTVPVDSAVANLPATDAEPTEMDWQEASHLPADPEVSQKPGSVPNVFVYTRNADGILTDPD
ncbi:MAG TPA: hypothetical protein VN931_12730 [Fibrobacteria bacterium]|nr:hypothetical protein [Fibrobacteria bacterium]